LKEKISTIINGRNPFKKDDYLIEYDKDSEEEYLEENAEDIKSNENSDEEEINEEDEEEVKWIVPDGHLSEDEVSEKEDLLGLDCYHTNQKYKSIMEILEIRKNYSKPVIVSFNSVNMDFKVKNIQSLLKARIYSCNTMINKEEANHLNHIDITNLKIKNEFPLKIISNGNEEIANKGGISIQIRDRLEEVIRQIHFSYLTKDYLVKEINKIFPNISKKSLENFFKYNVIRNKCDKTHRVRIFY
jgi:hypothetical protein